MCGCLPRGDSALSLDACRFGQRHGPGIVLATDRLATTE